ncbi:MAG: hypothetical protein KC931_04435 [Candidatus Omnitrophica bacterium]|nr:hypothetical protein [Candidatus Omnitrophota bacterium]MCA9446339.1 hypothetical protein [Candidatus Omnitrophota bacterium]
MILKAKVENGKLALEEPLSLPDGTEVTIDLNPTPKEKNTLGQRLSKFSGRFDDLPPDFSEKLDEYLYGRPDE